MIYTNVSFVGCTSLADELMLLGPRFATGVIVTQVVPAVGGYSSAVLEYKNALAKYFPGEAPDYVSLEGYVAANVLIQALKRAGPQVDTEKLIDNLEAMRNLDLGLGTSAQFRPRRAPGFAQDLGNGARRKRKVPADRTRIASTSVSNVEEPGSADQNRGSSLSDDAGLRCRLTARDRRPRRIRA